MQVHPGRLGLQTLCVLACLSACIGLAVSAAQDQPPRPDFRTEANYVRVDVYPTHDGAPIADLRQEDFEIFEDKVPQTVDRFEHIVVRSGGPQETRREPNTIAEARQALDDSRARVFVLFLDVNHVEGGTSRRIGTPLVKSLDSLIGPDDLIAVMTPGTGSAVIPVAPAGSPPATNSSLGFTSITLAPFGPRPVMRLIAPPGIWCDSVIASARSDTRPAGICRRFWARPEAPRS